MMTPTILCVDDEPHVLHALKRALRHEPYRLLTAASGSEGLSLLDQHTVQVVLSDQRMPKMLGTEFLNQVKSNYPEVIRMILTGYADVPSILDAVNRCEIYRFITKPWDETQLKRHLQECLLQHELMRLDNPVPEIQSVSGDQEIDVHNIIHQAAFLSELDDSMTANVLDYLPVPVIVLDDARKLTYINAAASLCFPADNQSKDRTINGTLLPVLMDLRDSYNFDLFPIQSTLLHWQDYQLRIWMSAMQKDDVTTHIFVIDDMTKTFDVE